MGYLLHILLAAAIQALGEAGLDCGLQMPWGVLLLCALPHWLAHRARAVALTGAFRRADGYARAVYHSPLVLHAIAVLLFGWVRSTSEQTANQFQLTSWPTPALALALAPFLLFELLAIDAYTRVHELAPAERKNMRAFQLRMFLSALAPLLFYLVLASIVGYSEEMRVRIERIALVHSIFVAALLFLLALLLPNLLSNTWDTVPIGPGPVREYFHAVAARAGFAARSLRIWRTSHMLANAMIVGLIAKNRVVLFSDSLLAMLAPRELAAVFAHEIGHAKRHHVAIFLTWIAVFFLAGDLLVQWVASETGLASEWGSLVAALGVFGLWFLAFGWLSRRFELEADLYALELLEDPLGLIAALERVGGRLRDVAGWRHFSTAGRVRFISRAAADPSFVLRFKNMLRGVTWLGILLASALFLVQLRDLLGRLPQDQILVDLCLGDYADAQRRAAEVSELEDWQKELIAATTELSALRPERITLAEVRTAFEQSLERADLRQAWARAQLLELRGDAQATHWLAVLDAMLAGDEDEARALAQALTTSQRSQLEELFAAPRRTD